MVTYETSSKKKVQAGAELGQAQVRLDDIAEVVIEVVAKAVVKLKFTYLSWWVGGCRMGGRIKLISTLVEVVVEVEVELGKNTHSCKVTNTSKEKSNTA